MVFIYLFIHSLTYHKYESDRILNSEFCIEQQPEIINLVNRTNCGCNKVVDFLHSFGRKVPDCWSKTGYFFTAIFVYMNIFLPKFCNLCLWANSHEEYIIYIYIYIFNIYIFIDAIKKKMRLSGYHHNVIVATHVFAWPVAWVTTKPFWWKPGGCIAVMIACIYYAHLGFMRFENSEINWFETESFMLTKQQSLVK